MTMRDGNGSNPAQRWRLATSVFLSLAGMALLMMGFWVPPPGVIDQSVLLAYGEVMTFVGALFGIDYAARQRQKGRGNGETE